MSKTTLSSGINQPIVFFGTEEHSLIALRGLVDAGLPIAAVVTKPDAAKGRGKKLTPPAVKVYADAHSIAVWQPTRLKEITEDIKKLDNPIGVLVSYGKIIPKKTLEVFTPGIINVHPWLLPKYRGPSPIESAIVNRDNKTGVTIMRLISAMDAGPIYQQVPYVLDFTETKPELYNTLFTLGTHLLISKLPAIVSGELQPMPQDDNNATYCALLSKEDGDLDLTTLTPGEAEARVRGYLGYPRTRVTIGNHTIIITKAHGVMTQKTPLDLMCANGAFLSIDELIAPSGKTISAAEFLRGYSL
ncbi:MAG TPA: methionyl-tRNA formyltransferase [Candidatus Saccharimonadales bacterium]|nr:methionyl-tRNA formyltransferase [Candidatus Saccharimonadales bacterium]